MRIRNVATVLGLLVLGVAGQDAVAQQWQLVLLAGEHTVDPVLAAGLDPALTVGEFAPPPSQPMKKFFVLAERATFMHPKIEGMARDPGGGAVAASSSAAAGGAVTVTVTESKEWRSYGAHSLTLNTGDGKYQCYGAKLTESGPLDPSALGEGGEGLSDVRVYGLECLEWHSSSD